jgi:hypothetical protein
MYLLDGFKTLISFTNTPTILLREKSVTPLGLDGGDKIDITTMRNIEVRTYSPQHLIDTTDLSLVCSYDPAVLVELLALINVEDLIVITHSDGTSWEFFGALRSFIPNENTIGEQPTANLVISPTNVDTLLNESVPTYIT